MFENYPDIMSAYDVADELHVSRNRVYKLLKTGALRGHQEGHVWKVAKVSLIDYVMSMGGVNIDAYASYSASGR